MKEFRNTSFRLGRDTLGTMDTLAFKGRMKTGRLIQRIDVLKVLLAKALQEPTPDAELYSVVEDYIASRSQP